MNKRFSSTKSKRVRWFADAKLCQVKLFLPEDSPSKIGSGAQDQLQAKASRMLQSDAMVFDDPPPGFGGLSSSETLKRTCVPQTVWKCPPVFILNNDWHVVAGELSKETDTQKRREMRLLEAVYPRPSNIPPSPSVSPDLGESDYDDRETPIIPVIAVEEEDTVAHEPTACPVPVGLNSVAKNQDEIGQRLVQHNARKESNDKLAEISTASEADVAAAASAAFTAIMKSNEKGNLIDTDLLVKILKDPKMIGRLLKDSGVSGHGKVSSNHEPKPATSSVPISTNRCQSTMSQKPLYADSSIHNVVQQNVRLASNPLLSSELTQIQTLPLSNAKSLTASQQTDENSHQFCNDLQFSLHTSYPMSSAISSSKLQDLNKLLQVMSALKSTSQASISDQEPPMAPSFKAGHSFENYGPNMISSTAKQNQSLPPVVPSVSSSLQYSSSSDGLIVPPVSSVKTTVVKDVNYYKSLIKLHGSEGQVSQEDTQQYQSRASELTAVSEQGGARAKIQKRCRFFNSAQGCRNGLSCPFQHDSSLKLQVGSKPDAYSSKRIKLSRGLT
ncbi:Zinc finger CCCH domain-containing protein 6 [Bienertia sinuspersici]